MTYLTVALDVMGGDNGPSVTVPAALQALDEYSILRLILVGLPEAIAPFLTKANFEQSSRLKIIPAKSAVVDGLDTVKIIRNSQGTSIRIALELVKSGQAEACVSAGDTGTLVGLARMLLKPIGSIDRPALMTVLPSQPSGKTLLLDLGANIGSSSYMLIQFAVMGSIVAEEIFSIHSPRVALLNIGQEETKGLDSIRSTATMLKTALSINYIGYLEANELLTGKADVVVCDGFIGNITLKAMEGAFNVFLSLLTKHKQNKTLSCLENLIEVKLQNRLIKNLSAFNPEQYNGACLLGLHNTVIKSHGAANRRAFFFSIGQAVQAIKKQVPQRIANRLESILQE